MFKSIIPATVLNRRQSPCTFLRIQLLGRPLSFCITWWHFGLHTCLFTSDDWLQRQETQSYVRKLVVQDWSWTAYLQYVSLVHVFIADCLSGLLSSQIHFCTTGENCSCYDDALNPSSRIGAVWPPVSRQQHCDIALNTPSYTVPLIHTIQTNSQLFTLFARTMQYALWFESHV